VLCARTALNPNAAGALALRSAARDERSRLLSR